MELPQAEWPQESLKTNRHIVGPSLTLALVPRYGPDGLTPISTTVRIYLDFSRFRKALRSCTRQLFYNSARHIWRLRIPIRLWVVALDLYLWRPLDTLTKSDWDRMNIESKSSEHVVNEKSLIALARHPSKGDSLIGGPPPINNTSGKHHVAWAGNFLDTPNNAVAQ